MITTYVILDSLRREPLDIKEVNYVIGKLETFGNLDEIERVAPFERLESAKDVPRFIDKFRTIANYFTDSISPKEVVEKVYFEPYNLSKNEHKLLMAYRQQLREYFELDTPNQNIEALSADIFDSIEDLEPKMSNQQFEFVTLVKKALRYDNNTKQFRFIDFDGDKGLIRTVKDWSEYVDTLKLENGVYAIPNNVEIWKKYELGKLKTLIDFILQITTPNARVKDIEEFATSIEFIYGTFEKSTAMLYKYDNPNFASVQRPKESFFAGFFTSIPKWFKNENPKATKTNDNYATTK